MNSSYTSVSNFNSGGRLSQQPPVNQGLFQAPITSGNEDIVLQQGNKKDKKKVVIILIIVLLVTVGLIIFLILINTIGRSNIGRDRDMKTNFNRLANYVVIGDAEKTETPVFPEFLDEYYFVIHQNIAEDRAGLYDETNRLMNDFINVFNESYNEEKADDDQRTLKEIIDREKRRFDFMKVIYVKDRLGSSDITDMYIKDGRDATLQYLEQYYDFNGIDNREEVDEFLKVFRDWYDLQIENAELYEFYDCVIEGKMNLSCMEDNTDPQALIELNTNLAKSDQAFSKLREYFSSTSSFLYDLKAMNNLINNKIDDSSQSILLERGDTQ